MLKLLRKNKQKLLVSVGVGEASVQLAVMKAEPAAEATLDWRGEAFQLIVNDEQAVTEENHLAALESLLERYERLNLKGQPVQLVLSPALTEHVTIDRPDLPAEEIRSALRWSLKDLVKISGSDLLADYYQPAVQVSGTKKINVLAASRRRVGPLVELLDEWGLEPQGIISQDLALTQWLEADERSLLLYENTGEKPQLEIIAEQQLVVSRRLGRTPAIKSIAADNNDDAEALALEVQRSQDYYSGQLRQAPLAELQLAAEHDNLTGLGEVLAAQLGLQARILPYPEWVSDLRAGDYSDLLALSGLSWLTGNPAYRLNLFDESVLPEQPVLSLGRVALVLALVIVVLLGWRGLVSWETRQLVSEREQLQSEQQSVQEEVRELSRQVAAQQVDTELENEIARLERHIQQRRELLRELRRRGQVEEFDYAALFRDLVAVHIEGIWLTRIQQRENQLTLRGKTLSASALPRWLENFEQGQVLGDRQFAVVELERDSRSVLNFALHSAARGTTDTQRLVSEILDETETETTEETNNNQDTSNNGGDRP